MIIHTKRILLIPILLLLVVVLGFTSDSTNKKKELFYELSRKYCTNALIILKHDSSDSFIEYIRGNSREDYIKCFNTAIHETTHGYNFDIGGFEGYGYFITKDIEIIVPKNEIINSNKLNSFVSYSVRKKCPRYPTYIGNKTFISSQEDGIFGLLDEYCAYYQGLKAEIELRNAGIKWTHSDWTSDEFESYYEFRLFISWYLQYCKVKHPKIYTELYKNNKLRIVFTLLDNLYTSLAKEIKANDKINLYYSTDVEKLFNNKDTYELNKFRKKGVTLSNYKSFY